MLNNIKSVIIREKNISLNIMGAFLVKGASMVLSLFTMPAYMRYFNDNAVLGIWYTMLSVLTWIMMFDLGIGNGLRNKLAETIAMNNDKDSKEYISSAYIIISIISLCLMLGFSIIGKYINWSSFLNITEESLNPEVLRKGMEIIIYGVLIRFILGLINSILYAMQKSAINNLLVFISNLAIFLYVSLAKNGSVDDNLIKLSYWQVIFTNLPLVIVTFYVFAKPLKGLSPAITCFRKKKAKSVLNIGLILLWLQIVAMIILSTHAFLITRYVGPKQVVEYNIYYKVFNTIASIIILALTPIWSAVTKAQAEYRYSWIAKAYKILFSLPILMIVLGLAAVPFLQWFFDFWLKENSIEINIKSVIITIMFCSVFVLHYVNTTVNNGLSIFRVQMIWMTFGAVLMIPLSILFCRITGNWTGVLIGCMLSIMPYELIQPFSSFRIINDLDNQKQMGAVVQKNYGNEK